MAFKIRDYRLQSLTIGGRVIPLGGDGEAARITRGELGQASRGMTSTTLVRPNQPDAQLTVTVRAEDAARVVLDQIVAEMRAAPGSAAIPRPGTLLNIATGESYAWETCWVLTAGDVVLGSTVTAVTYTFALVNLTP